MTFFRVRKGLFFFFLFHLMSLWFYCASAMATHKDLSLNCCDRSSATAISVLFVLYFGFVDFSSVEFLACVVPCTHWTAFDRFNLYCNPLQMWCARRLYRSTHFDVWMDDKERERSSEKKEFSQSNSVERFMQNKWKLIKQKRNNTTTTIAAAHDSNDR